LLALETPAITAFRAVFTDHAMARNRNRYWIRSTRARDRAARCGLTNCLRHLAVRPRRAEGDRLQISPYAPLKCSGADIQRQSGVQFFADHLREQGFHPGL